MYKLMNTINSLTLSDSVKTTAINMRAMRKTFFLLCCPLCFLCIIITQSYTEI
jgi:hypothetical protein